MESAPGMNSGRALSTAPSPEDCAALNNTNTCKKKDQNKAAKACSGGKPKKCAKLCSKKKKSLSAECKAACCQMQASRPCVSQPTHNREPYDTLLSDTVATDPSVEPMPTDPSVEGDGSSVLDNVQRVRAPPPLSVRAAEWSGYHSGRIAQPPGQWADSAAQRSLGGCGRAEDEGKPFP